MRVIKFTRRNKKIKNKKKWEKKNELFKLVNPLWSENGIQSFIAFSFIVQLKKEMSLIILILSHKKVYFQVLWIFIFEKYFD